MREFVFPPAPNPVIGTALLLIQRSVRDLADTALHYIERDEQRVAVIDDALTSTLERAEARIVALTEALEEAAYEAHARGLIRDHGDGPDDFSGCRASECVERRALLAPSGGER